MTGLPDYCLAFDMASQRRTHNLCSRDRGHDGDHGNRYHSWPNTTLTKTKEQQDAIRRHQDHPTERPAAVG